MIKFREMATNMIVGAFALMLMGILVSAMVGTFALLTN